MTQINKLLEQRIDGKESQKVKALARQSSEGFLSSFAGMFKAHELTQREKNLLESILLQYQEQESDIARDLHSLIDITSEIKAIHNQAALLHGERIKRAQTVLKNYKEGAFTAWLLAAYGNRQTPYNFLLYYEFCQILPKNLREVVDTMPRQAIYVLASRKASPDKKFHFIETHAGASKHELLGLIRTSFPLHAQDKRRSNPEEVIVSSLQKLLALYKREASSMNEDDHEAIKQALKRFLKQIGTISST